MLNKSYGNPGMASSQKSERLILGVGRGLGLSLESVWGDGLAPIHLAALHGRLDCLKSLVEKYGVDANLPSTTGWRPIHLCISSQTGDQAVKCLQYLLSKGADQSVVNDDGVTPVHQAASEGHLKCLKLLLERGAHIDAVDVRGHKPIDLARLWGHRKCARILANGQWHKDKTGQAVDLFELRKSKMEQVLKDLEKEEQAQRESAYFGETVFNDWLVKHGLSPQHKPEAEYINATSSQSLKQSDADTIKQPDTDTMKQPGADTRKQPGVDTRKRNIAADRNLHGLIMKPNSVSRDGTAHARGDKTTKETPPTREETTKPVLGPHAKPMDVRKDGLQGGTIISDPAHHANITGRTNAFVRTKESELVSDPVTHHVMPYGNRWNATCKVGETFHAYQPILKDAYPRDIYTMMPTAEASPRNLNIRHPKIYVTDEKKRIQRVDEVLNVRKRLSSAPMHSVQAPRLVVEELGVSDMRHVLYRCSKAVQDIQQLRHPAENTISKYTETGMHFTDDVTSALFKNGLLPPIRPVSCVTSSHLSTSSITSSERSASSSTSCNVVSPIDDVKLEPGLRSNECIRI